MYGRWQQSSLEWLKYWQNGLGCQRPSNADYAFIDPMTTVGILGNHFSNRSSHPTISRPSVLPTWLVGWLSEKTHLTYTSRQLTEQSRTALFDHLQDTQWCTGLSARDMKGNQHCAYIGVSWLLNILEWLDRRQCVEQFTDDHRSQLFKTLRRLADKHENVSSRKLILITQELNQLQNNTHQQIRCASTSEITCLMYERIIIIIIVKFIKCHTRSYRGAKTEGECQPTYVVTNFLHCYKTSSFQVPCKSWFLLDTQRTLVTSILHWR